MTEPQQDGPPTKKSLGPVAWIAIGCGALILIAAVVVMAGGIFVAKKANEYVEDIGNDPAAAAASAAETFVRFNPALEMIESDRESGTMTIREKESGKTVTVNYEDIYEGRLSFEGPDGQVVELDGSAADDGDRPLMTVTTDDGVTTLGVTGDAIDLPDWLPRYGGEIEEQTGYTTVSSGSHSGMYSFTTPDSPDEVSDHWQRVMESLNLEIERVEINSEGYGSLRGVSDDYKLEVTIVKGDETGSTVVFAGPE